MLLLLSLGILLAEFEIRLYHFLRREGRRGSDSGSAMELGKFSALGHLIVGPIAGGGCLDIFSLVYLFSFLSPSLGDGPIYTEILAVKPNQPTKQPTNVAIPNHCPLQILFLRLCTQHAAKYYYRLMTSNITS